MPEKVTLEEFMSQDTSHSDLLYAREYGEREGGKTPFVLMHGLFGSSSNWGRVAGYLSEEEYLLVPDLRNHGRSFHAEEMSYEVMRDDLIRLLDHFEVDKAVLIGHSMGGKVAMHTALSRADRVSALAVVDIAPVTYSHDFDQVFDAFRVVDVASLGDRKEADARMATEIPNPGVRAFLLQNLVRQDDKWGWRANLSVLETAGREIAYFPPSETPFSGPCVFIHGSRSDYVLPEYHQTISQYFTDNQFCTVRGAGHWVYAEQPEKFQACLDDFRARL